MQQRPAEPARDPAAEVPDSGPTAELERGDEIVQQLSIAKYALAAGDTEQAMGAIDAALTTSRGSLSELAGAAGPLHNPTYAGSLVRSTPAASATTPRPIPDQPTEPLAAD